MLEQTTEVSTGVGKAHWEAIRSKTYVSLVLSAALPTVLFWFLNPPPPVALLGPNGLLGMMVGACIGGGFALTNIVTFILRYRVKKGRVPRLSKADLNPAIRWLAGNWFLRAIECAIVTLIILLPVGVVLAVIFPVLPMDRVGFAFFNMISGAAVALVVSPIAGLRALADGRSV